MCGMMIAFHHTLRKYNCKSRLMGHFLPHSEYIEISKGNCVSSYQTILYLRRYKNMISLAKWITLGKFIDDISPMFRREIEIKKDIRKATMYTIALGYGIYSVNGKEVTDEVLTTQFTSFDRTVLYNKYDVTELLNKGKNCLGIMVGNGCYNQRAETAWNFNHATWRDTPKAIMRLLVEYNDGETEDFITDSSWKATIDGPIIYNHVRSGEIYDARKEMQGWQSIGFDDSKWHNATIAKPPGGDYKENIYPNPKIIREIDAVSINDKNVYDFGENLSGWVEIEVFGECGAKVHITYSEKIKENGEIDNSNINEHTRKADLKHEEIYILKGGDKEIYHPVFNYHGFRYALIETEGEITVKKVTAQVVHTDIKEIGDFWCSDEMLNKLHEASRRATLTNFLSIPTDCPHREQNGWTGDAHLSAEQALMNFDITASYKKWLCDIRDAQRKSGQIPSIVPTSHHWGFIGTPGPTWDSALILIPWYVYNYTGDTEILKDNINSMKKYIDFLIASADGYFIDFGLGDWCSPEDTDKVCVKFLATAYFYTDALIVSKICEVLGDDGNFYKKLAENIKKAIRTEFIDGEKIANSGQTAYACAIYQGLLEPQEEIWAARKLAELVIENDYHIDCGIMGTKYIFTALAKYGYDDVLYKMVTNPTYPSYAYWILNDATTLCEDWEMKASLNHHMYSEIDHWLYKYIAGINISPDGVLIKPHFIGLENVRANSRGVFVEYTKEKIKVKSPVDFTIEVNGEKKTLNKGEYELDFKTYTI